MVSEDLGAFKPSAHDMKLGTREEISFYVRYGQS